MTIFVPYHQDERLRDSSIPLPDADVVDTVDVSLPDGDIWARLVALYDVVANRVAAARPGAAETAAPVVVVSGDCVVASATIAGVQRAGVSPSVVWFDAHGDVHTLNSSTSGYLGGMALRLVMGENEERFAAPLGLHPLTEQQAVLIDARDLDPAEVDYLATSEVRRYGVEDVEAAHVPDGPLVLHIDLDVISTDELPGMRFPAPDGPTQRAVLEAARRVLATGRVVSVDIACPWHPARDEKIAGDRARVLAELLTAVQQGR